MEAPVQPRVPWGMIGDVSRRNIHPKPSPFAANAGAPSFRGADEGPDLATARRVMPVVSRNHANRGTA